MLAPTAIIVLLNTFLKVALSTGELEIAGTQSATKIIPTENRDAKIPAITISFARFLP